MIAHALRRADGEDSSQSAYLLTHAIALLVAEDQSSMVPTSRQVFPMESHEIADVKRVEDTPGGTRIGQVLVVGRANHPRFPCCFDIDTAEPQSLHDVIIHRIFIHVQPNRHHASGDVPANSASIRTASISSAAISLSIASRLAW